MSDAKYTKEPWYAHLQYLGDKTIVFISNGEGLFSESPHAVTTCGLVDRKPDETPWPAEANAKRIIACINKCAGIQDLSSTVLLPADTLEKAREALNRAANVAALNKFPELLTVLQDALSLLAAAQKQGEG